MGKKGKKKKKESEPVDPYAGYLVLKLKFACSEGIDFTCLFRNRKTEEKYDAPATVGDLFKELWRQSEQNEEFDEDHTEGRRFAIFGPILGSKKENNQLQCILLYKEDSELELEKDLGFKSHDTILFDSLTDKAWGIMLQRRPPSGYKEILEAKWYVPPPPQEVEEDN